MGFVSIAKRHMQTSASLICHVRQSLARPSADSSNMASSRLLTAFPRDSSTPPRLQPPLDPHQPPFRQHRRTASSPPHLSSCIARHASSTTHRRAPCNVYRHLPSPQHHCQPRRHATSGRQSPPAPPPSPRRAPPPPHLLRAMLSSTSVLHAAPVFFLLRLNSSACPVLSVTYRALVSCLPRACLVRRLARRFTVVLFARPRRSMSIVMYPPARLSILSCCMRYTIVACCGILKLLMSFMGYKM